MQMILLLGVEVLFYVKQYILFISSVIHSGVRCLLSAQHERLKTREVRLSTSKVVVG